MEKKINKTERAVARYCDMMVETIKGLEQGWRKTWLTTTANGRPMNADGRAYNRMNEFFLQLVCDGAGYELPVFLTFNQCRALGAMVRKGEKSFPVLFWNLYAKNSKTGNNIKIDDYHKLTPAEQKEFDVIPVLKTYDVFNLAQTNIAEVKPEMVEKLKALFTVPETKPADGMYTNDKLDALIAGAWVCPIKVEKQDRAFYSIASDSITLPLKEQFNLGGTEDDIYRAGQEFYSTMLHEMAHSTGAEKRLNRTKGKRFGDADYGREELVAELTAALCGHELGFNTAVEKNNAAYLSGWLKTIKREPSFLVSVLADVSKAAKMIDDALSAA